MNHKLSFVISIIALVISVSVAIHVYHLVSTENAHAYKFTTDPQVAAGEWKVELQTPPCESYKNIQVIYPKESGAPITVECDLMPVATR